jgi:glycosyltransferase involved in cell wall biosynthesis
MKSKKRINIAFLTVDDPRDKKSWSGSIFYMAKALQEHCGELNHFGPMSTKLEMITGLFNKISQLITKKKYDQYRSVFLSKQFSKIIARKLDGETIDLIFAPAASREIAFLETEIPIVYVADATFALINNYYPDSSDMLDISIKEGNLIEKTAISKADLVLYSSKWAARSAVEDYNADESKVKVLPFGANIDEIPDKDTVMKRKKSDKCILLFLGIDWERKGGSIAFETLLELEKLGIKAELIVCGCIPPKEYFHERMEIIPFLDKNDSKQRKELNELLLKSDFLLLPTRSEAYGIVFCEANSFGLPVITTKTGGVPSVIDQGKNGFMLSMEATGVDYAVIISKIYLDDELYYNLVKSSRKTFDEKLNWDVWAKNVCKLIDEILKNPKNKNKVN